MGAPEVALADWEQAGLVDTSNARGAAWACVRKLAQRRVTRSQCAGHGRREGASSEIGRESWAEGRGRSPTGSLGTNLAPTLEVINAGAPPPGVGSQCSAP